MKNKSFKRLLSAVTIGAMTLGLMTGCSGGGSEEAETDESGAIVNELPRSKLRGIEGCNLYI